MDIASLSTFISSHSIPTIPKKPKTFLGIAKQPHFENVLSNIYAFYLNQDEEHGMNDLFLNALMTLINESSLSKEKNISFSNDYHIETESATKKGGRIDLLLQSDQCAIIIENKVHHHLNNDLKDYWDSVLPNTEDQFKIGIVLSVKKYSTADIYHNHFINITHQELLEAVMLNLGKYTLGANDKYLIHLKDVYQNTINLSNHMEKEKLDFYYNHQEELNKAVELKFAVRDYIKKEIENACGSVNAKLDFYAPKKGSGNEKRLRYYKSKLFNDLKFTIVFDGLLRPEKKLGIYIEISGKTIKQVESINRTQFGEEESKLLVETFNTGKTWAHFALKHYNLDTVENLSDQIKNYIETDFASIYQKVFKHLIEVTNKEIEDLELDFI